MIDYSFYRRIGDEGIKKLYAGHPDDVFETVDSAMSDLPYVDQMETTNRCNIKCVMCPRGQENHMTRAVMNMARPLFQKIIDQIDDIEEEKKGRGISEADFRADPPQDLVWEGSVDDICNLRLHHFGSPILDPEIVDRVTYVKSNTGIGVHFSETASNLRTKKVKQLFDAGLDRLTIALDGTNAEEFYRVRGIKIDFDKVLRTVQEIIRLKIVSTYETRLYVQLIQMKDAPKAKFIEEWEKEPEIGIIHKPFFPYPDVSHDFVTSPDNVFNKKCKIPFTSVTVLADGRVVPCNSDYNGEHILGDLNTESLEKVWNGETFRDFRRDFVYRTFESGSLCNRCGYYPFGNYKNHVGLPLIKSTYEKGNSR
ncbi:MAG: radical SAM/SPASM domain-containing protein [Candidatus Gracilibacteria bacterium]